MPLTKFIRLSLPVSPAQLPGATDEVLPTSTSKLPSFPAPSCTSEGHGPPQHPLGCFTCVQTSLHLSSLASPCQCSLFPPCSTDPPSRETGPHSHPSLPFTHVILGHQGCPGCPQAAGPRQSGSGWDWGRNARFRAYPIAMLSFVTQAWKGHCLIPPFTETALQVSSPKPSLSIPPFLPPFLSMGSSPPKAFILLMCIHSCKSDQANTWSQACKQQICLLVWPPQRHPATSNSSLFTNPGGKSCAQNLWYQ